MNFRVPVLVALAAAAASAGERLPVLRQVEVPHSYYFREMYLPQATSGPQAPSWSPDGRELVYAMQGTLWRQQVGSGTAQQLTDGPGYDAQPDWSPDGRLIAYASYRGDAVDLWALEVATGRTWPLTSGGAVNVEPRWSPDGSRLAFVSTRDHGRWHLFALDVEGGKPGALEQLTTEHESGLPRYYYSRFDHEISPSWSPDGRELLFVSNRGHIWGSGGFWRMPAKPGAAARELRYEETTWKARPDWSRDGRRVVYSSYLGGQWHQLWLMTAEGGDPFPLTYGDWDVTAPRWSPDGRTRKHRLTIDAALTAAQRDTSHLLTRMLDDLYWVMSYSRWQDERYWQAFRDALLREHPQLTEDALRGAKEYNAQRYHYQGIGRYDPDAAMARGLTDLGVLANLVPGRGYVHGEQPTSIDAAIYGFIANIYFYDIDTPLKRFVVAHDNLVRHCRAIHTAVS